MRGLNAEVIKMKTVEYEGEQVHACPDCGCAMLDDSRIAGETCTGCGKEYPYKRENV